jgi:hypothetical protein
MPLKPVGAKTIPEYFAQIDDDTRRKEMKKLYNFFRKEVPELKPFVIGSIIGFGKVTYSTKSGCGGDWFIMGIASNKTNMAAYACVSDGKQYIAEKHAGKLGKVSVGKSCIRFKKFEDLDLKAMSKVCQEVMKLYKKKGDALFQYS